MPMDDDGLDPDGIELPASFLYTIPTFQNPSGRTLSLERRHAARRARQRRQGAVLEDDPYSLVRYEGERAAQHLRARRRRGRRSTRSRSRRSSRPGLRVGYLVGSADADRTARGARRPDLPDAGAPRRRRPCSSSSAGGCSTGTSSASSGCCASGATRCSRRSRRELPEGTTLEQAAGRLLHLARPARGHRRGRAARRGHRAGRHLREGQRLLPGRPRRRSRQPGLPSASSRPTTAAPASPALRAFFASCARRRWRYSCESSTPTTDPTASSSSIIQIRCTSRRREDEVRPGPLAVLDDERDQPGDRKQREAPIFR